MSSCLNVGPRPEGCYSGAVIERFNNGTDQNKIWNGENYRAYTTHNNTVYMLPKSDKD